MHFAGRGGRWLKEKDDNDVTMFNKPTMMKRQIKTIQKSLDTCYIDQVYVGRVKWVIVSELHTIAKEMQLTSYGANHPIKCEYILYRDC